MAASSCCQCACTSPCWNQPNPNKTIVANHTCTSKLQYETVSRRKKLPKHFQEFQRNRLKSIQPLHNEVAIAYLLVSRLPSPLITGSLRTLYVATCATHGLAGRWLRLLLPARGLAEQEVPCTHTDPGGHQCPHDATLSSASATSAQPC